MKSPSRNRVVEDMLCEICHLNMQFVHGAKDFFARHDGLWEWWSNDPYAVEWRKQRAVKEAEERREDDLRQADQLEQHAKLLRDRARGAPLLPKEPPEMPKAGFDHGFTRRGS